MSASPRPSRAGLALAVLAFAACGVLLGAVLWPLAPEAPAGHRGAGVAALGPVGAADVADPPEAIPVPEDDSMTLYIPALARAEDVPVESAPESATAPLRRGALHVEGTGFPWQRGANVYLAAHRLGFPGTKSHLLFWDLPTLGEGDGVLLTDSEGTCFEYRVFRELRVGPREVRVTKPVPGKSVVSLQTCTLPDYTERVVVQAELVKVLPESAGARLQGLERR